MSRVFQIEFATRKPIRRTAETWYAARQEAIAEFGAEVVEVVMIPDACLAEEAARAGKGE